MANFVSWTQTLADFKNAMADRNIEHFFESGYENSRQMRITYTKLGNVQEFLEWLEAKAAEESVNTSPGRIPYSVGGY
jgi:hypothetical protein